MNGIDSFLSDDLVAAALNHPTYGSSISYTVTMQNLTGYLNPGSSGINHGNGIGFHFMSQLMLRVTGIAIDGVVKLLTVTMQVN